MSDPRKDPRRRCMPFNEWPERDQAAWFAATTPTDPFEEGGLAAHWRKGTRSKVMSSYGRLLTHLRVEDALDPDADPGTRLTEERLRAYIDELSAQVAPITLAQRIVDLHEAIRVMAPGCSSLPLLNRAQRALTARARPSRDKRRRVVSGRTLFDLGQRLMAKADATVDARADWRACRYRDGLMISLLALRALRRRNLAGMVVGRHIRKVGNRYVVSFGAEETKSHDPIEMPLPAMMTPHIDHYLTVHRPALLKGNGSDRFWISYLARPMAHGAIYDKIRAVTMRELGVAINLNLFRDCQVTALANDDPEHVLVAMPMLGHNDARTAERYYNQARTNDAVRQYQDALLERRRRIKSEARCAKRKGGA